jgi:hypothetical protein
MKVVQQLVSEQEQALVRMSPEEGAERLYFEKLKSDGAKKLAHSIAKFREASLKEERANAKRP